MPMSDNVNPEEIHTMINHLNEKMNELSSIIQKFGLDLITKMGQTNSKIKILTDKIDKLDKTTLDIKALQPKLNNIIDNQNILESEIDLIKSLIQRTNMSLSHNESENGTIGRNESITINKEIITDQFKDLIRNIDETKESIKIKEQLAQIKQQIFELTGGHKILYEISQFLTKINENDSLSDTLKIDLKEKIEFWSVKLQTSTPKKVLK